MPSIDNAHSHLVLPVDHAHVPLARDPPVAVESQAPGFRGREYEIDEVALEVACVEVVGGPPLHGLDLEPVGAVTDADGD